jgi:transposase-like protein
LHFCKDKGMKLHDLIERFEGKDNSNWKGDAAKSRAKHLRKGPATKCSVCGSTKNVEWNTIADGRMRQYCKSCHSKYDKKGDNFNK